jgi:hypothetical protein
MISVHNIIVMCIIYSKYKLNKLYTIKSIFKKIISDY